MEFLGIASVASITVICYLVGEIFKVTPADSKLIPVVCGIAGAILGVVALNVMPGFPADNILDAIAVGIVSGLAATGFDQVVKQLKS